MKRQRFNYEVLKAEAHKANDWEVIRTLMMLDEYLECHNCKTFPKRIHKIYTKEADRRGLRKDVGTKCRPAKQDKIRWYAVDVDTAEILMASSSIKITRKAIRNYKLHYGIDARLFCEWDREMIEEGNTNRLRTRFMF